MSVTYGERVLGRQQQGRAGLLVASLAAALLVAGGVALAVAGLGGSARSAAQPPPYHGVSVTRPFGHGLVETVDSYQVAYVVSTSSGWETPKGGLQVWADLERPALVGQARGGLPRFAELR